MYVTWSRRARDAGRICRRCGGVTQGYSYTPYARENAREDSGSKVVFSRAVGPAVGACCFEKKSAVAPWFWMEARALLSSLPDVQRRRVETVLQLSFPLPRSLPTFAITLGLSAAQWAQVSKGAHTEVPAVVRTAYLAAMRQNHPDVGGSTERAKEINAAYEQIQIALRVGE